MRKQYHVYIATNKSNTVLYTGVTSNLPQRMYQHKHKILPGFSAKYNIHKLVYYCAFDSPEEAITAEKKIKSGSRKKKIALVTSMNPEFQDLSESEEIASSFHSSQ